MYKCVSTFIYLFVCLFFSIDFDYNGQRQLIIFIFQLIYFDVVDLPNFYSRFLSF